jgi:hypothetical protein
MKKKFQVAIVGVAIFVAGVAAGQGVDPRRNPNIAEAQRFCHMAIEKINEAQTANQAQGMGGHADNRGIEGSRGSC